MTASDPTPLPEAAPAKPQTLLELLRELFDLQMRDILTTRMVPHIYALALLTMGGVVLYQIITGYMASFKLGLLWTLFGPPLFLSLVVAVRVLLEFVLVVFRLAAQVDTVTERTRTIQGLTEEVVQDLPRIQFWKMGRKRGE